MLLVVQQHAGELIRFARRFSWCADDAQDAYQRALEILVRQMRTEPPENLLPWLRTVIRHEAWSVREQRARDVVAVDMDFDREVAEAAADPAERVAGFERLAQTAEALRRLKPQEITALVLRGEGLTYRQIAARTGWTYTRVNRTVTEGRRALIDRLAAIESGAECDRWLPLLSALADGETSAGELAELRPHLRSCAACRATVRELHEAPRQVAAIVPVALLPVGVVAAARAVGIGAAGARAAAVGAGASGAGSAGAGAVGASAVGAGSGGVSAAGASAGSDSAEHPVRLVHHVSSALHGLLERATMTATRAQSAIDALSGPKLAAVAASTAAIAGGGAAIHEVAHVGLGAHHRAKPAQVAAAGSLGGSPSGAAGSATGAIPLNTAAAGSGVVPGPAGPSGAGAAGASGPASASAPRLAEFGLEPASWPFGPAARTATAGAASTGEFTANADASAAKSGSSLGGEFASAHGTVSADSGAIASASTGRAAPGSSASHGTMGRATAQFATTRSGAGTSAAGSSSGASGAARSGTASSSSGGGAAETGAGSSSGGGAAGSGAGSSSSGGGAAESGAGSSATGSSSASAPAFSPPSSHATPSPVDRSAAAGPPAAEFAGP